MGKEYEEEIIFTAVSIRNMPDYDGLQLEI